MSNSLTIEEKTVMTFLQGGEKNHFLIPVYQRAYDWEESELNLLFDDLKEFTQALKSTDSDESYFLGTIVTYVNDDDEREIIDGQQRIVSLLMLLRVIYEKLSAQALKTEFVEERLKEIRTSIWQKLSKGSSHVDYEKIFIRSESVADNDKDLLHKLLSSGQMPAKCKDKYSKGYQLLQRRFNELYDTNQSTAEWFVYYLLNQTVLFLINAQTRDAALTIFSTINNRGKSLSDSDILRAKIYSFLKTSEERRAFNDGWREFGGRAGKFEIAEKDIFSYYMYYLRAIANDSDNTTIGVRAYFTKDGSVRLDNPNILEMLERVLDLTLTIDRLKPIEGEPWSEDVNILQIFDTMRKLQNYAWRGAAVTYYLSHREEPEFRENFMWFLRKLMSQFILLYILNPERSFLRNYVLKLDLEACKSARPEFKIPLHADNDLTTSENLNRIRRKLISADSMIVRRIMLKAIAYSYETQHELLPTDFEIEHIMPQKWSATYSSRGYTEEKFEEYVEQTGNLTVLEKKLNRTLSNAPFVRKRDYYRNSKIAMTRALAAESDDWTPESIVVRSNKLAERLIEHWQHWSKEYDRRLAEAH